MRTDRGFGRLPRRRRAGRWGAAGVLASAAWIGTGAAAPPDAPPPGNLVANPSFETDPTVQWKPFRASFAQVVLSADPDPAPHGTRAVTVTAGPTADAVEGFSVDDDAPSGGARVPAGTQFVATAWMRAATASSVGRPGKVWVREFAGDTQVGRLEGQVTLTTAFQKAMTPTYTVQREGSTIDVYAAQNPAAPGDAFTVDLVTLVRNLPPQGEIAVSPASPVEGDTLTFSSSAVRDPEGRGLASRAWDTSGTGAFADGGGVTATRRFTTAGTYTVRLRSADPQGATGVLSRTFTVRPSPGGGGLRPAAKRTKPRVTVIFVGRRAGLVKLRLRLSQSVRLVMRLDAKRVGAPGYARLRSKTFRRVASGRATIQLGTLTAGRYRVTLIARNSAGRSAKAVKRFAVR